MSYLMEQAGGLSITGFHRIMVCKYTFLHSPIIYSDILLLFRIYNLNQCIKEYRVSWEVLRMF